MISDRAAGVACGVWSVFPLAAAVALIINIVYWMRWNTTHPTQKHSVVFSKRSLENHN